MGLRRSRRRAKASKRWAFGLPYRRRAVPQASDCQMYKAVSGSGFLSLLWMKCVQSLEDITSCKQNLFFFFFFKNNAFLALIFFAFHSDAHILGKRASSKSGRAAQLSPGGSSVLWVTRGRELGCGQFSSRQPGAAFPRTELPPTGSSPSSARRLTWLLAARCAVQICFLWRRSPSASVCAIFW